jgi:hypothetical protein
MYVCVHVHVCVHVYLCMYVCVRIHLYVYMCLCMYVRMCVCVQKLVRGEMEERVRKTEGNNTKRNGKCDQCILKFIIEQ